METTTTTRTLSSRLEEGLAAVRDLQLPGAADAAGSFALDVADIVRALDADDDVVMAAALQPLLEADCIDRDAAVRRFGAEPDRLAVALRLLGRFGLPPDWTP